MAKRIKSLTLKAGTELRIIVAPVAGPRPPKIPRSVEKRPGESLVDLLRRCIRESGLSQSEIARGSKVVQPAIHRLTHGNDIGLGNAQKLMDYFRIEVTKS